MKNEAQSTPKQTKEVLLVGLRIGLCQPKDFIVNCKQQIILTHYFIQ